MRKRIWAVFLSLLMLTGMVASLSTPVYAAEKETIVIAGSDFQVANNDTSKIEKILNNLEIHGITKVDSAFFVGDYTLEATDSNKSQYGIQKLKDTFFDLTGGRMLFAQGNHDIDTTTGLSRAGDNDPANKAYGVFIIHEDQYREWGNNRAVTAEMVKSLRAYLEQKRSQGWKKPIFILNHIPLHWSNRTRLDGSGTDADLIFDALNEYGGKGLNIIYLYGHNHSGGYDDFMGGAAVYLKKGDKIEICQGGNTEVDEPKKYHETRTLNFTYMNAGYIGYYSTTEEAADATVTMSVFRIRGEEVIITRYDGNSININTGDYGVHDLKSKGVWNEDFYQNKGYHAELNTLVYASSRKVTATTDEPVDTPLPAPTESTTVTTTAFTTTNNKSSSVVFNKQTGTTTGSVGENSDTDRTEAEIEQATATDDTANTTAADESAAETTKTNAADAESAASPIPWWAWLGMGVVALLLIGAVIAIILLSRPVKP